METWAKGIEVFKEIPGFENLYAISNWGRVKSLERRVNSISGGRLIKEHSLKSSPRTFNYPGVTLAKENKKHRVMAELFLDNPDGLPVVNHKDCDPTNNFIYINSDGTVDKEKSNLEWCSIQYNATYAKARERAVFSQKKPVAKYNRLTGTLIAVYSGVNEASRQTGIDAAIISLCCNGKIKRNKKFIWRFL